MEAEGYKWQDMVRLAQNRSRLRTAVVGLCAPSVPEAYAEATVLVMINNMGTST